MDEDTKWLRSLTDDQKELIVKFLKLVGSKGMVFFSKGDFEDFEQSFRDYTERLTDELGERGSEQNILCAICPNSYSARMMQQRINGLELALAGARDENKKLQAWNRELNEKYAKR